MIVQGRHYEHTLAFTGPGLTYQPGEPAAIGRMVLGGDAFDVAEFSLSAAIILADRGTCPGVPIPVFPARAFVHGYLFVRTDSKLHTLADLAGCRIGLRDFASTGAIWFRGMLAAEGVDWRGIEWVTGPKPRFAPPPDAKVTPCDTDLEQCLLNGGIDLFFSARVKDQGAIRPLLTDHAAAEAEWVRQGNPYPIIHTVLLSPHVGGDAARAVYDAYVTAKQRTLGLNAETALLPWSRSLRRQCAAAFGGDPLPYGLGERNRLAIETHGRDLLEQGLIRKQLGADLFYPGSAAWPAG